MTLRRLRWWGLAGSVLVASGSWLAGATPGPAPAGRSEALWGTDAGFRVGLVAALVGLAVLSGVWWRLVTGAPRPSRRWLLTTGLVWLLPVLLAAPLGSRDLYAYACQGAVWLDGHDPYTTGPASGGCPWLAQVPALWQDATAPYGPVGLVVSAAAVAVARLVASGEGATLLVALAGLRLMAVVGVGLVVVGLPRLARGCGVPETGALGLGVVTPLVAVHAIAGGHHDALIAGLLVAGLALAAVPPAGWPIRALVGAGVLLGLAVAVKVTAVVAAPFGLLLAARRGWGAVLGWGAGLVGAVLGAHLVTGLGPGWVAALSGTGALVQWSSLPSAVGMTAGYLLRAVGLSTLEPAAITAARGLGLLGFAVLAVVMFVRAVRRWTETAAVVRAAGVVLAAVVLLGPVVYPWYALAPLAVLAAGLPAPGVRRWLAVVTVGATWLTLPSGLGVPSLLKFPGALAVTGLLSWLGWRRWRAVLGRPAVPAGSPAPTEPPSAPPGGPGGNGG